MSHHRCNQRCTLTRSAQRKDDRGVDLISDVLPFGHLWYGEPNAVRNAIGYATHSSQSHDAVIRVYDVAGNVIDDISGSYTPFNPLELNRTALSDKRNGRREYRTCNSFSKVK